MKDVILSFDYELFFGTQSGTVEKSLIYPTNLLLNAMDRYGLKGNFFVDWQMLKYLKQENTERTLSDLDLIQNQLCDMVKRGHRVELHIHPHWVDAKYNGDGTWDYSDFSHYSLSSFSDDEVEEMFVEGKQVLLDIIHKIDPHYEICAFRAGGWAVQPFNKLKRGFKAARIKIDSSCAYGQYYKSNYSSYNFRSKVLKQLDKFSFSDDVLQPDENGDFIEIPISTFNNNIIHIALNKLYDVFVGKRKRITDGTHKRPDLPTVGFQRISMLSLSGRSPLSVLLSIVVSRHQLITMIDHPKDYTLSNASSLKLISKHIKSLTYFDFTK